MLSGREAAHSGRPGHEHPGQCAAQHQCHRLARAALFLFGGLGGCGGDLLGLLPGVGGLGIAELGIFRPVLDDLALAARDINAILRSGRKTLGGWGGAGGTCWGCSQGSEGWE